jgi:hypothetical protein
MALKLGECLSERICCSVSYESLGYSVAATEAALSPGKEIVKRPQPVLLAQVSGRTGSIARQNESILCSRWWTYLVQSEETSFAPG